MSLINELNPNIQNNNNSESFNQIPQTHHLCRNQSQIINQTKSNIFSNPTNFPQEKKFGEIPIKVEENHKNNIPSRKKSLGQSQSAINVIRGFNPMNHIPPKYDIYGYLKPLEKRREDISILENKDNIKIPWCTKNSNKSGAMTRTELLQIRKKEKIPDISYDLDKDGYVGGRDYVISKRFDIDNDGKLNEQEKRAAYEGIANNIEENYIWNVDNRGYTRRFRIMQKRGKIIDAEDFWPIRETYPIHPMTNIKPHCATLTELKQLRKQENINQINKIISDYENKNPNKLLSSLNNDIGIDEEKFNSLKPLHSSMEQIKN